MPDNFKQVVNLQSKLGDKEDEPKPRTKIQPMPKRKTIAKKQPKRQVLQTERVKPESRAKDIDHIYNDEESTTAFKEELLQIDRPKSRNKQNNFFKQLSIVFFLIILAMLSFYFIIDKRQTQSTSNETIDSQNLKGEWYYVELSNEEVYYGFIRDTSADPVVLEKVYYNYNQISGGEDPAQAKEKTTSNIRLVKRGKESHGPDGTMNIVRSQLLYMEVLGEESKILKAILDYEK
jgi:hypothetical protein